MSNGAPPRRYIPPGMRGRGQSQPHTRPLSELASDILPKPTSIRLRDLYKKLGYQAGGTLHPFTHRRSIAKEEPEAVPPHPLKDLVCYFLLHVNAHPKWPRELWFHNRTDLLEDDRNLGRPIPCIIAVDKNNRSVAFDSWKIIESVRYVVPGSEELIEMLAEKEKVLEGTSNKNYDQRLQYQWVKVQLGPVPSGSLRNPLELPAGDALEYVIGRMKEHFHDDGKLIGYPWIHDSDARLSWPPSA